MSAIIFGIGDTLFSSRNNEREGNADKSISPIFVNKKEQLFLERVYFIIGSEGCGP